MSSNIVSAVFDDYSEAQRAVSELRSAGVDSGKISIIGRDEESGRTTETNAAGEKVASVASKTAAGAGIGALLGVAALAIPGVGPLAAAGAIAETAAGGAALTGTAIGAAAGGLSGLLTRHGVSDEDARYYEDRINHGGVFVSVQPDEAVARERAEEILYRNGGHSSTRSRTQEAL